MGVEAAIIGSAAAPIISGLIGGEQARGSREAAERSYREALESIASMPIPDIEKQKLMLELPQVVGEYQARLEQEGRQLTPSAMQGIQVAPELKAAQRKALETLTQLGETGLTAEEKVAMSQARREAAALDQARQQAVLQEMASRGMGGSGAELIAKLKSGEAAAERATQASESTLASAQRRALEAITGAGSLAGQQRGQEFGEEAQKAQAADIIARFNLENAQELARRNIERQNIASQQNLATRQRIGEQQVALRNQQQAANKALLQQQYENELRKRGIVSGAQQQMGGFQERKAAAIGQQYAEIGLGAGKAITGIYNPKSFFKEEK